MIEIQDIVIQIQVLAKGWSQAILTNKDVSKNAEGWYCSKESELCDLWIRFWIRDTRTENTLSYIFLSWGEKNTYKTKLQRYQLKDINSFDKDL